MKILLVVGTRPNFVKIAPIIRAIKKTNIGYELIHTGQHYDWNMSQSFFEGLEILEPDVNLNLLSGTYAAFGNMMRTFSDVVNRIKPDVVVVVGDANSTFACALVAARKGIKVAHVEAGLRSFDRTMPEEINRILTDAISDLLFTTEESANQNLKKEGIAKEKIFFVGNVMIDTLVHTLPAIEKKSVPDYPYILATFHRPSNVDVRDNIELILDILCELSVKTLRVIAPLHPRTRKTIASYYKKYSLLGVGIHFVNPMGYVEFLAYMKSAKLVITDSGGIQEETTYLGVPCLTMRKNTERPVTVGKGTNYLVGRDKYKIMALVNRVLNGKTKEGQIPELWDGKASERIVAILNK